MTTPRVQDFTDRRRTLQVEVDASPAYELLLSLFVLDDEGCCEQYEVDEEWLAEIDRRGGEELRAELAALRPMSKVWLGLLGLVHDTPEPRTIESFLGHLGTVDPVALRRILLDNARIHDEELDPDLIDAAAGGDADAVAALIPAASGKHVGLRHLLLLPPEETVDRVTGLLRRFAETCFADRDDTAAVLDRDADAKRALARTMPPERLVEIATNGVTFSVQPEMAGVVLVPSIVVRPWVIITEHEGLRIFCYSVADEHIEADPAAPPSWLVQVYKALGDERRLRLLNRLAESNASLAELADEVDLAKSTVHHHLRTLRAAGLVRVTVGDDREYSLRRDTVPEAARLLEVYLTRSPGDASGAGTDLNRGVGS